MPAGIQVKSVLNKAKRRDPWFLDDFTINPYSGCSFNCLFCYIRGSKYGSHMEQKLSYKSNALSVLDRQLALRARKGEYGFIVMSSATDPYLQFEEELQLSRKILEIILKYRFPVHIITRSALVWRDVALLEEIGRTAILPADLATQLDTGLLVTFSFSTLDDKIANIFEPGATPTGERLIILQKVAARGIKCGISMMPLLPFITDKGNMLEDMYATFKQAGAAYLFPATLSLYGSGAADSKVMTMRAVKKHFPDVYPRYEKFFSASNELPAYYRLAFEQKCKELSAKYALPGRII